jgi:hypothetical protein
MKKIILYIVNFLNNLARRIYSMSLVLNLEIYEYKTIKRKYNLFYRINALLRGYSSDLYAFLKKKGYYKYSISEFEYRYKINNINKDYGILFADKQLMYVYFNKYLEYFPTLYFYIENGRFKNDNFNALLSVLKLEGKLILKQTRSYGGKNVHLLKNIKKDYYYNEKKVTITNLRHIIRRLKGNYIITEYVKQSTYASNINRKSVNSMRIMTLYDKDTDTCWIGGVTHRFGTKNSGFVDNVTRGGLSASVNIDTGFLEKALLYEKDTKEITHHPDTKVAITGTEVNNWKLIQTKILELAKHASRTPYLGWDVVSTEDGFKILEINECADIHLIQYHNPPLKDERNQNFFKKYGIKIKK